MTAARANGWIVTDGTLRSADWSTMAATQTGPGYRPALSDPLLDI